MDQQRLRPVSGGTGTVSRWEEEEAAVKGIVLIFRSVAIPHKRVSFVDCTAGSQGGW